jgi:cytoskeletal protein RodZ
VSIGEVLSLARCRAGLSIREVSQETRIREGVIWDIEHDDFSSCGGAFYARGHIRAMASVVGLDPAPLIEEYDRSHRPPVDETAPALIAWRPPDPTGRDERRHQRNRRRVPWVAALCLVVLAIFGIEAYHFATSNGHSDGKAAQAAYNRTSARPHAKATPTPSATKPSPSPTPSDQLIAIKPAKVTAYGPYGAAGDDPQAAYEAIDASGSTRWRSGWYSTADFGGTQTGTGLMLDLGRDVTVDSATITVGTPGASIELRGGDTPATASGTVIGGALNGAATMTIRPEEHPIRYLLVWFTQLPPDTDGTYRAVVYNIALQGHS